VTKERQQAEEVIDAVCEAIGVDSGAFSPQRMDAAVAALQAKLTEQLSPHMALDVAMSKDGADWLDALEREHQKRESCPGLGCCTCDLLAAWRAKC
jgi:hypothetical protein